MTLYRYGTLMRPALPGSVPRDGIHAVEDTDCLMPSGHRAWSIIDYERKLTDKEISDYELEYICNVEVQP